MMQPFTIPGGLDSLALAQVESSATAANTKTVDGAVSMVGVVLLSLPSCVCMVTWCALL